MPMPPRSVFAVFLVAWAATIWWLSSLSDPGGELGVTIKDWLAHGIAFAAGGFLARGTFPPPRHVALPIALCIAWGVIDEWHQSYVPGRDPNVQDVLADAIGSVLGVVTWSAARRVVRESEAPHAETTDRETP